MYSEKLRLFTCGILNPPKHKNDAIKNSISPGYGLLEFLKLKNRA